MKKLLITILISILTSAAVIAQSSRYQRGYYRKSSGTFVQGHFKTHSDGTNWNNYSTRGNRNPYNGSKGYRAKDYSAKAYNYGKGHTIRRGSRGGQFYYNSRGNKTYVPKRF